VSSCHTDLLLSAGVESREGRGKKKGKKGRTAKGVLLADGFLFSSIIPSSCCGEKGEGKKKKRKKGEGEAKGFRLSFHHHSFLSSPGRGGGGGGKKKKKGREKRGEGGFSRVPFSSLLLYGL